MSAPAEPGGGATSGAGAVAPRAGIAASPSPERTLVILQGVVARDAAGLRGASRGALQSLSAHLGPGVHAFLGAPEDGTIALCDVLAGVRPALRGVVLIHSENPWSSPAIRSCTGALLASPDLPEARTVRASIGAVLTAAGRTPAEADGLLAALGIGALATRPTRGLSFPESRAVELAIALHIARTVAMRAAPPVLVLFEPCADVAVPAATRRVDEALAELRSAGACVILATSSPADARRLGDVLWVLHRGAVLRRESGDGRTLAAGDAELAVSVGAGVGADASASTGLRALAAAVCAHPAVRAAYWDDPPSGSGRPAVLRVRGADRDACALAVIDAAASAGIAIEAITSAAPDLAAVRSASVAWVQRARGAMRPPVPSGARPKATPATPATPAAPAAAPPRATKSNPLVEGGGLGRDQDGSPAEGGVGLVAIKADPLVEGGGLGGDQGGPPAEGGVGLVAIKADPPVEGGGLGRDQGGPPAEGGVGLVAINADLPVGGGGLGRDQSGSPPKGDIAQSGAPEGRTASPAKSPASPPKGEAE